MPQPVSEQFQLIPCDNCGSDRFTTLAEWNQLSQVVQCRQCGLQLVNPIPGKDYLDRLYQQDEEEHPYYRNYLLERTERRKSYDKQYHRRLQLIEKYAQGKGKLLDIGCGGGFFLKAAEERGWDPHGIDIVPGFVEFARDELQLKNVHCRSLEQSEYEKNFFDVIVLWDLIEHLPHPSEFLKTINNIIRPGGLLVIWTPNANNAAWLKGNWYGYEPLQHLYFYSPATLKQTLQSTGFHIVYKNTNRAKKGFFTSPQNNAYKKPERPLSKIEKLFWGVKRDFRNFLNPVNYISPLLDWAGFGFNLYVIAEKSAERSKDEANSKKVSSAISTPSLDPTR
jgi:2-polyprenyl-3-methyl-5-hydroxy-6-metoxy-1,4-benzoquinol methylase/ribosomal protein S27E